MSSFIFNWAINMTFLHPAICEDEKIWDDSVLNNADSQKKTIMQKICGILSVVGYIYTLVNINEDNINLIRS